MIVVFVSTNMCVIHMPYLPIQAPHPGMIEIKVASKICVHKKKYTILW